MQVDKEIGHGGFATVVVGEFGGGRFARKVMRRQEGLITSEAADRKGLQNEAELLKSLKHDTIVQATALLTHNGQVVGYAMELLGETLAAASKAEGCAVAPTCRALHYLHNRLVAHTDVKPANLAFTWNYGTVKLLHFVQPFA